MVCAAFYYKEYYLLDVTDVKLIGAADTLTVLINAEAGDRLLTVRVTDTFGNHMTAPVQNGAANFTGLNPDAQYTVELDISGLHKLQGTTVYSYSTPARTNIVSFTANTGSEDGSVILNFTVDGQDFPEWTIGYCTAGEEEQFITFGSHMTTITGLTVGSTYTFRLLPAPGSYLTGTPQLEYTASKIIQAENLTATDCADGALTVAWNAPEGVSVESWTVRCYNDNGYDQRLTTQDQTAIFQDVDTTVDHTVEVTAQGMTVCTRAYITANPITITEIHGDNNDSQQLTLSWSFTGAAPENGWLLLYTIDGSPEQKVLKCPEANAVIAPKVPGSHYAFTLQAADGVSVFGGTFSADTPEAEAFSGYDVTASNMDFRLCRRPDIEEWDSSDLSEEDFTTAFAPGEAAAISVLMDKGYNVSYNPIGIVYVIRDSENRVISVDSETRIWEEMWDNRYCELNLPALPQAPGSYTLEVYFNGAAASTCSFTITE